MIDDSIDSELLLNLCKIYDPEYIWLPNQRRDLFPKNNIIFSPEQVKINEDVKIQVSKGIIMTKVKEGKINNV